MKKKILESVFVILAIILIFILYYMLVPPGGYFDPILCDDNNMAQSKSLLNQDIQGIDFIAVVSLVIITGTAIYCLGSYGLEIVTYIIGPK
jgi:hypothetical protein